MNTECLNCFLVLVMIIQWPGRLSPETLKKQSWAFVLPAGAAPLVIAKGGFSGVFPDSSQDAYYLAKDASAPGTAMWCDVQLTKDGVGVCHRDINMNNCTTVGQAYPARKRTYVIDGVHKTGWFVSDFTIAELRSAVRREYSTQYMPLQCKAFRLQRWVSYVSTY